MSASSSVCFLWDSSIVTLMSCWTGLALMTCVITSRCVSAFSTRGMVVLKKSGVHRHLVSCRLLSSCWVGSVLSSVMLLQLGTASVCHVQRTVCDVVKVELKKWGTLLPFHFSLLFLPSLSFLPFHIPFLSLPLSFPSLLVPSLPFEVGPLNTVIIIIITNQEPD